MCPATPRDGSHTTPTQSGRDPRAVDTATGNPAPTARSGIGDQEGRSNVGVRARGEHVDREVAVEILAASADPATVTAEDVMTADPETVGIDAGVFDLVTAMCDASVRRMPVVDGETLAGIIALDDLIVLLARELDNLAGVIAAESPPY